MGGKEMKLNIIILLQAALLTGVIFIGVSITNFADVMRVVGSSVAVLSHHWEDSK
ncbi:Uncharacterised protein [Yersinia enterocolitica]|nr:hypothetical protein [Yersinia enterocolitica]AJI82587.1 putative exported protein [Yersinia enterocolitica]AJJ24330.1 hypothetical protein CH49_1304 [Yersinia enterocolitica]EKA27697.1 hypothetical protein YWA314_08188 [Yersinia enterocolitica subsp. enterocolitica WA-314]EKN3570419.1 hypothetical protein [Yersinia enterocolitica]EKN4740753.1 hypothetical protein [Yersinia enterocolitica]